MKRGLKKPDSASAGIPVPIKPDPCPLCGLDLRPDSYCANDQAYFREPDRRCHECRRRIGLDGYCAGCRDFRGPKLTYRAYADGLRRWDAGETDRLCSPEEMRRGRSAFLAACGFSMDGTRLTVPQRLEVLRAVAAQYPGIGWEDTLEVLETEWALRPPQHRQERLAVALAKAVDDGIPF